ncbi:hypothetical protein CLAFUW4_01295 [Fulvia fulva]|uniref:Uncharacterized protein n=1 Tax=Passalora fulva TaxID=5499 RepID=A0A9Q8P4J5_PASFU|nr:uncharacterized protein CLAFUR5_01300 [Fulvia fulva]KAK4634978.1 hypothetical protein CLAFUR4_01296 [Fulvia fulva]KAK4637556.1 hypothetical protein CLAFUR0_01297 [Fulvia fulva]UJO13033.1 hypothetical protein CLAFUR5_01300 [Fulvia fulva]WPV08202.1 hypothetical protein CLAFUW4_01295 [Fulvia fulva]WPV25310.1 hypothetical protein CLAFUW7_01300 [Fulvia fulva]
MPPIRRYLRITKFSVLEVRIYLHKPSDASWLLSSRDDVLGKVIQEVRPKVLPKLREENEIAKKKGSKKKRNIKDVVATPEFEVAIFLKENSTRHSLLTKEKEFTKKDKFRSNSGKLTGWLNNSDNPIRIDEDEAPPEALQEDADEDVVALNDIPEAPAKERNDQGENDDEDALFVSSGDEEFFATQRAKPTKKRKRDEREREDPEAGDEEESQQDDKKKLALDTSYDGFSIYGRILCLIVTRKGKKAAEAPVGGSQMMEQWVSTQATQEAGVGGDEDG